MNKLKQDNQGFTLVEIMIAVAIIGILSGIALPNILVAKANAEKNSCLANVRQLSGALEMAATLENATINSLDEAGIEAVVVPDYLRKMPDCASGTYSTDGDGNVQCSNTEHAL